MPGKKRERAKRAIPNLFTLGNAACGFSAILCAAAFGGPFWFSISALLLLVAMVFDAFDGRVARMTGATSNLGANLDSLCDAVSFGLAPAVLYFFLLQPVMPLAVIWVGGLLYVGSVIYRLARFNVETENHSEDAHLWFSGLPSTGGAFIVGGSVFLLNRAPFFASLIGSTVDQMQFVLGCVIVGLTAVASVLMVSRIRFPHLNMLVRLIKRQK